MYIIHIATELAPFAKAGGLGDVVYGLSQELTRIGHTVEVILPKYDCIDYSELRELQVESDQFSIPDTVYTQNTIWSARFHNLKLILIESHHPSGLFDRNMIYGCPDDMIRFSYFSKTAIEYLFQTRKQPDALHVHDWATALTLALYKTHYQPLGYLLKNTVLTIHCLEHQGRTSSDQLIPIGVSKDSPLLKTLQDVYDPTLINILKGGIEHADQITTVSAQYQQEIQTPEGGFGLDPLLIKHTRKLTGILNGIDETFWNPETDPYLVQKYPTHCTHSTQQFSLVLSGKQANKNHLRSRLNLQNAPVPLVACVTRLVPQKAPQLIRHALYRTLEKGGQFILLGSTPIPEIHLEFQKMQQELKNNPHARILIDTDEELAHLIFASADMFIIPSLFEPCGLTQMISQRYGTVPIVRVTGGLANTVFDIDTSTIPIKERNGFTFDYPDEQGVNWALDRALTCYAQNSEKWHQLMQNGMKKDWSWKDSALKYIEVYTGND